MGGRRALGMRWGGGLGFWGLVRGWKGGGGLFLGMGEV